ncbi:MAG: hypothetical protein O3B24_08750 [Verrucomicrobia bacterium]|nr:hypothetical protein [Verrucomicrobiota bacterium]
MHRCKQHAWRRVWAVALSTLGLCGALSTTQADEVQISATLIRASNDAAPGDGRLKGIESKLRSTFGFKSYQHYGGGSAKAAVPSSASVSLGHGNSLTLKLSPAEGNRVEAAINWRGPSGTVLSPTVVLTRGGPPVILGGAQQDGGTMIISVSAR